MDPGNKFRPRGERTLDTIFDLTYACLCSLQMASEREGGASSSSSDSSSEQSGSTGEEQEKKKEEN